jgi:peptide-methionine (R)-S-oxide reductase
MREISMTEHSIDRARRTLLIRGLAAALSGACASRMVWAAPESADSGTVSIEQFAASGKSTGVVTLSKVVKSDVDWRHQLSAEAYQVTRRAGTEYAFSGRYASNHADGLYRCICCDTALYDSSTKYEAGTGWPSFWQAISARNVVKTSDSSLGMSRDAISCHRCDSHLGHVFDDGPKPTGLRYCMNSVALNFVARA